MRKTNIESIYNAIKEKIINMEYAPGTSLIEEMTAKAFNVSRTPIREVFRMLEANGLVEIVPNKGIFIKRLSVDDIKEIYVLREALEGMSARLTAKSIQEPDCRRLSDYLKLADKKFKEGNLAESAKYGDMFHKVTIEICGNKRIIRAISELRDQLRQLHQLASAVPNRIELSNRQHRMIMETIMDRNADLAEQNMRIHLRSTMEDVITNIIFA
jgi:DNA-binding GntR family transcriptional regulator